MKEVELLVNDPVGLHARPATVAVNAASKYKSDIKLIYNGKSVNMKSIMGVMSLGVPNKSKIIVSCDGEDEEDAVEVIAKTLREQKIVA